MVKEPEASSNRDSISDLTAMRNNIRTQWLILILALSILACQLLLGSVLYAPDMLSAINHGDGVRFMIVPDQDGQPGKNLALPGTFYTRHRASGDMKTC